MKPDVYVLPIAAGDVPAGAVPGVSQPQFIIRDGSDFWVPLAMVHYDAQSGTGIAEIRQRFEAALEAGAVVAAVRDIAGTEASMMASDNSTRP